MISQTLGQQNLSVKQALYHLVTQIQLRQQTTLMHQHKSQIDMVPQ
jgi:hypothetical protein